MVPEFDKTEFEACFAAQKAFFESGATLSLDSRLQALDRLKAALTASEPQLLDALDQDLGKPPAESYGGEIGILHAEISFARKHLKKWMKPQKVRTPLFLFPSKSQILSSPKGQCLIVGPWNYPIQLQFAPLIGAIAAGNTAILKPSELAPESARAVESVIQSCFPPEWVAVFHGDGAKTIPTMLETSRFDHIFFTGSSKVGTEIAVQAARKLTPVTLELGGKSPAIIDQNSQVELAARRVTWGKFFNAGQTCVAPDYVIAHTSVKEPFVEAMKKNIEQFYGSDKRASPSLGRIIHDRHFERLRDKLQGARVLIGGDHDAQERFFEPTIVELDAAHPLMEEEIFGPILPILTFQDRQEVFEIVAQNPAPLALYLFTNDSSFETQVLQQISFGGGCVNDVVAHLANPNLPFGGVGNSGFGRYHGKYSFDEFSNQKGILNASTFFDLPFRYPPYNESKLKLFKRLLK